MISKTVTSADGATISYCQSGKGPGLIIVHGGLETWRSHSDLAEKLSDTFTVYVIDRRGRGLSSPPGPDYGMHVEVADIEALARETDARYIFGVSSGGLISLQTSSADFFKKTAVYEPPLLVDRGRFDELYERLQGELARNGVASSLITGMEITELGPTFLLWLPRWILRPLINLFLSLEDGDSASTPLRVLAPTLRYDFSLVKEMKGTLETFASLKDKEVLLLSGTASRPYLIHSCEELERVIPGVTHTRLRGLTHLGAGNKNIEGKPEVVAEVLRGFFTQ